jgi:hypothetical protein
MTAKLPTAGRSPKYFVLERPVPFRPCGEMMTGIEGFLAGPYQAGSITAASRSLPLCAV